MLVQPGADNTNRRPRVPVAEVRLATEVVSRSWDWVDHRLREQGSTSPAKRPTVVRPPHLEYTLARNGIILAASEYTVMALGYPREQLIGTHVTVRLRDPNDNPRETVPDLYQMFWIEAPQNPGKMYSYDGGIYLRHADGHHIDCPNLAFYWDEHLQLYAVDVEITEAEIMRVRMLFPQQWASPFEHAEFTRWFEENKRQKLKEELRSELLSELHPESPDEPEMRKWADPEKLRQLLREIHKEAGDVWDELTLDEYCEKLQAKSSVHISEGTLRDRVVRKFMWGTSLRDVLRDFALEDTADSELY